MIEIRKFTVEYLEKNCVTDNPKPTKHWQQQKQNNLISKKKSYVEDVFYFSRKSECFC